MGKSVSFTVYPSAVDAELLTVGDAMRQILDLVGALEAAEAGDASDRQIVWRLREAHTNSPPFTVTAEAFSRDPSISVAMEADRVTRQYAATVREVLNGERPGHIEEPAVRHLQAALRRNLNGIGQTRISIDDSEIDILPAKARAGLAALERIQPEEEDKARVEYGSIEGQVIGLTTYYSNPAVILLERLSGERVVCSLTEELAARIGPSHNWLEAWEGSRLLIGGEIIYDKYGKVKRVSI